MKAHDLIEQAAKLVANDRDKSHGSKQPNHQNIADLWNAYLGSQLKEPLKPSQVAALMCLLKIARTKMGTFNLDNAVDAAGYAGIMGELMILEQD